MRGIYDKHQRVWLEKCDGCLCWVPTVSYGSRWVSNYCGKEHKMCFIAHKKCGGKFSDIVELSRFEAQT